MRKKRLLKKKVKIMFNLFVAIAVLLWSVFVILTSINFNRKGQDIHFYYNEKNNLDYNVFLKENEYFNEQSLSKDKQYIASLIDYINVNYKYSYSTSKPIDANYKYKIVATIVAEYRSDSNNANKVWSNDYVLLEEKSLNIKDKTSFVINEKIDIDYQKYNDIINKFKKDYMLAVNSQLYVNMLVNVDGKYVPADKVFNTKNTMTLSMPLSVQTLEINADYNEINNGRIQTDVSLPLVVNIIQLFIGIVLALISIILLSRQIFVLIRTNKKQSKYAKFIKKTLHDYGDIIVEVNDVPNIPKTKSSEVKNFNELVNAQVETGSPILFSEISDDTLGLFVLFLIISSTNSFS